QPAHLALAALASDLLQSQRALRLAGPAMLSLDAHQAPDRLQMLPGGLSAAFPLSDPLGALGPRVRRLVSTVELAAAKLAELVTEWKCLAWGPGVPAPGPG